MENEMVIPKSGKERIVILGAGFGGFTLARSLIRSDYQVVLIDRNNFHQFQPLFYQVAMAGLEPSSIVFPLRKAFQKCDNIYIRVAEIEGVNLEKQWVETGKGNLEYDHLVVATGAVTNFFNNEELEENAYSLKSVSEALSIRNSVFKDLEDAITTSNYDERQSLIDIVIVGGGPTGVELAGALAEMKNYILPKDYRELDNKEVDIYLMQGGPRLLNGMSQKSADHSLSFLQDLGVKVMLNTKVTEIKDGLVFTQDGQKIVANKVIWAAGIKCESIEGISAEQSTGRNQLKVDESLKLIGTENVYVIGDIAYLESEEFPKGHPQVAQVAIQMAKFLKKKFTKGASGIFVYNDKGSMATIGRNRAVVDLARIQFGGFIAWVMWLIVHLASLIGIKNKLFVMINWMWNYLTYDQSLRLIIKPHEKKNTKKSLE